MKKARAELLETFGGTTLLTSQVISELRTRPFYLRLVAEQIYQVGLRSLPLVFVTAGSTGMVMALQFGLGLEKFGGKLYIPKIVSISIVRERSPLVTVVATSEMARIWLVSCAANWLTLSVRSRHRPAAPGTLA